MSAESKLREQICMAGASLFNRGLTHGSTGNISIRLEDGGWLMTPTGSSLGAFGSRTAFAARRIGTADFRRSSDQGSVSSHHHVQGAAKRRRRRAPSFDLFRRRELP